MELTELLPLVERFGGWAVVVWIVWWLTKRWEVRMTAQEERIGQLVAEQAAMRGDLVEMQRELVGELRELVGAMRRSA